MKITFPMAVRDLYSERLRSELSKLARPAERRDGDIVGVMREIEWFEEEELFDHRYTGWFYELKGRYIHPVPFKHIRRVWKPLAMDVAHALVRCEKIEYSTRVSILLGRDRGQPVSEVTIFCSSVGVLWRYDEVEWRIANLSDATIKNDFHKVYGGYLDEVPLEENRARTLFEMGLLLKGLVMLDADYIMGEASSNDGPHAQLARRLASIEIEVEDWYPSWVKQ